MSCLSCWNEKEEMIIEADNECNAKIGDWVIMELRNNSFYEGSANNVWYSFDSTCSRHCVGILCIVSIYCYK